MQVEIKIDGSCREPKLIILTSSVTEEVNAIVEKLSEEVPQIISGTRDEKVEILQPLLMYPGDMSQESKKY